MSRCTSPERTQEDEASNLAACPKCGQPGKRLDELTIRALVKSAALERRSETRHRFYPSPECPVVYFGRKETFGTIDIAVPVFPKARETGTPVCYCFGITVGDIEREIARAGRSGAEAHTEPRPLGTLRLRAAQPPGLLLLGERGPRGPGGAPGCCNLGAGEPVMSAILHPDGRTSKEDGSRAGVTVALLIAAALLALCCLLLR